MKFNLLIILLSAMFLSACTSRKSKKSELNYMENIEQIATDASIQNSQRNTIQPGDQLVIFVTAKDMDVVKPFNQNYSTSDLIQPNIPGGNVPTQGQIVFSGPMYLVNSEGDITFPELGDVNTKDKTLIDLKNELTERISKYVINPTVNIRIANFKVTILGEVNRQGEYTLSNGQGTLFNALGLAGDLTMYGKRDNVLVVRNVDGIITKERINLQDANFIQSPYFQLKQGDVIYVSASETKEKASRQNPNTGIYISAAGLLVTVIALLFK